MLGDLLHAEIGSTRFPSMRVARIDAQMAARKTLGAYLERALFVIGAGDDGKETQFNLEQVLHKFPRNSELAYPSASITTATSAQEAHNLSPTPLEATWNRYAPRSVLWKTAECVSVFQVDFWVNDEPTQEAIAAALPALFNPREDAAGVILEGPAAYWCLPVRCTLISDPERAGDTGEAVYEGERRLVARIRSEIDVVHLRQGVPLLRPVLQTDVKDPG